ncbi:MAG TPA: hypothetical protein DGH68_01455, partial [Bacteroidetes bacterium]|nr:hypothetical protein [Bacteroidota bacterium]
MFKPTVRSMKACVGITLLMMCSVVGSAVSRSGDGHIHVLRSDQQSVVFEYRPMFLPERTMRDGNVEVKLFDFTGSIPSHTRESIGAPDIRYETVPLGFPAATGNIAQVIAAEYEDIVGVTLAPVPTIRVRDDLMEIAGYKIDPERYNASSFVPAQVAEIVGPNHVQTMLVGSVKLFPIQFNPSTRTIRKYKRLVVEIVYGNPNVESVRNGDDLAFEGVLLNYAVARNWKIPTRSPLEKSTAVPSVLQSGDWYRLTIVDEGVYSLNPQFLRAAGINTAGLDPRTIKIFGNGGTEVPENILHQRPTDLVENAIYVEGESDGRFDEGDYVLFFAQSVRGRRYNTTSGMLDHYIHHYTEQNYYWLTFGNGTGRRMQAQPSLT